MPGLEFSFENAEILREDESADYVVECSGEFPTKKLSTDLRNLQEVYPGEWKLHRIGHNIKEYWICLRTEIKAI